MFANIFVNLIRNIGQHTVYSNTGTKKRDACFCSVFCDYLD